MMVNKFANALHEHIAFVDLPKLIGWASDFDHIKVHNRTEIEYLMKLNSEKLNNRGPKVDPKKGIMQNYKSNMLLLLFMYRANGLPEKYQQEIQNIIEKIPSLVELWLEISMVFHAQFKMRRVRKTISFKAMRVILKFSQHVIQGMWENDSQLMQLPFMTTDKINKISKQMKKKFVTLKEYMALTEDQRKLHKVLTETELAQVEKCLKNLPKFKLSAEIMTEGSEDIIVNDVVSIKIKIIREDLKKGEKAPLVCSRCYSFRKTPVYYVYLTDRDDKNIFAHIKLKGINNILESDIKFQAPPGMVGDCLFNVHCINDSYIGLDEHSELRFTVKQHDEERALFSYHEEDIKREPSLFEQALQGLNEENSDDELESDSEGEEKKIGGFGSKKHLSKKVSDNEISDGKDD